MKRIYLIAAAFISLTVSAQTAFDALNYSRELGGGTARSMAMGGAFNALGGDFSVLSVNPAGLGIYRSGELTFTPTLEFMETTTDPEYDFGVEDTKGNFNFNNLGYVASNRTGATEGLVAYNFAVGFNRLQNYHKSYRINSPGAIYSLTDAFAEQLNMYGPDNAAYGAQLAYDSYLMNESLTGGVYGSPLKAGVTVDYMKDALETGRMNEWVFSMAANISNTFYVGATVGLRDIDHKKEIFQTETFYNDEYGESYYRPDPVYGDTAYYSAYDDELGYVDGFDYNSIESTNGFGLNLKLGFLYRPIDILRFGLAIHTPTYTWMNVSYAGDMLNNTFYIVTNTGEEQYGEENGIGYNDYYTEDFSYQIVSPYKVNFSTAIIVGKRLALDVEGDVVGYDKMKIKDGNGRMVSTSIQLANDDIETMYKTAYNLRAGAEFRVSPSISLRTGFAYYGSPYKNANNNVADYIGDRFNYTGGIGFRTGDFFMDLAYVRANEKGNTFIYDDASDAYGNIIANTEYVNNRYMLTMGFKF